MPETLTIGDDHAVEEAEKLVEGINDSMIEDHFGTKKTRHDFAIAAANIARDRYSAGSTSARAALAIFLTHGLLAAKDFVADLEHHEDS